MRQWIDLFKTESIYEEWHKFAISDEDADIIFDIFKNPTRKELREVLNSSKYHDARGAVTETDLYIWRADGDIHYGVLGSLNLRADTQAARIMLDANGPFINEGDPMAFPQDERTQETADRLKAWCTNHPALIRLYGADYVLGCR